MALPKPSDFDNLLRSFSFVGRLTAGVDDRGRLIYQGLDPANAARQVNSAVASRFRGMLPPQVIDSAPLVRADFDTRLVDTIARVKIARQPPPPRTTVDANGRVTSIVWTRNPVGDAVDDWAATADGWLAIVRGNDYHVDWIGSNGEKVSSPKLAFDWRRLTDEDKQAKLDSARRILDSVSTSGRSGIPFGGMDLLSGWPEISSMTIKSRPSLLATSWTVTMFG